MSVHNIFTEFAASLRGDAPLLGLDLGTKTIGLSLSDRNQRIATPLETIKRVKFTKDAQTLLDHAAQHAVEGVVLGLPFNMDGSEGARAQSTRAFARNLAALTVLPITFWDERLSTIAAHRAMLDADLSRAKRAERVDHVAAGFILQGALDRLGYLHE